TYADSEKVVCEGDANAGESAKLEVNGFSKSGSVVQAEACGPSAPTDMNNVCQRISSTSSLRVRPLPGTVPSCRAHALASSDHHSMWLRLATRNISVHRL